MKIVADLHTHSVSSGHAYSTIQEMMVVAKLKQLEAMAITDHGPGMPGAPHIYYFGNMRVLPESIGGVRLFKGVEANIIDREGNLDVPDHYLQRMDIVLAGMHDVVTPYGSVAENTQAMIRAMQNPYVDIIVHPGNPAFIVDYQQVVQKAKEIGIVIEINNSSFCGSRAGSVENCHSIANLVATEGNLISIGSDAHYADGVGFFDYALAAIEKAGVKEEQILNGSMTRIMAYLEARRKCRPE